MNAPNPHQLRLLSEAVSHLKHEDYAPYLQLKHLLTEKPRGFKTQFRQTFENFYRLNSAGLSEAFKDRYFDLLFGLELREDSDPYSPILKELYEIPRRKGDKALQCSFVSKLVAIHDETRPIFDKHVSDFFGIAVPSNGSVDFRIAGFVANLNLLRAAYDCWAEDRQFQRIVFAVKLRHPLLKDCSNARLADLLVWTVGRKGIGNDVEEKTRR